EFTAVLQCRIAASTSLPKCFYMFARNSVSEAHDIWHKWVGDPGTSRTIEFPMILRPIEGGTWTIFLGCQGTGSLIIDSLVVREGRPVTEQAPKPDVKPVAEIPASTQLATGFTPFTIDAPVVTAEAPATIISVKDVLIPDSDTPVTDAVAEANSAALQKLVNQAQKTSGAKTLLFPKATYRFAGKAATQIKDMTDFTLDGQGSDFIFQKLYKGEYFAVTNCTRTVIKNFNIDWNSTYMPVSTFTKVVSVSDDKKTIVFDLPDSNEEQANSVAKTPWLEIFQIDPVSLCKSGSAKFPLNGNTPTVTANGKQVTAVFPLPIAIQAGLNVAVRHLYYNLCGFKIANCSHLTFDGINIYSLPGMGWLNTGATHHWQIINCNIKRREGFRNVLTTAADGIHTGESSGYLVIRNCEFTGLGDDCINLHDNAWQGGIVYGENPAQVKFMNCPKHRLRIEPGNVIRFFKPDYSPTGIDLTVSSVNYDSKPNEYGPTAAISITFTTPVPPGLSPLSIALNTHFGTTNVHIADCRFVRTNGRGILFAGNNATIENCIFDATPLQLYTEIMDNWWGEGQGCSNIVVRNNKFNNVKYGSTRGQGAAIFMGATIPWGLTEVPLFNNMLIENNTIVDSDGPALYISSARNIVARNNTIEFTSESAKRTRYAGVFQAVASSDLFLGGNTWIQRIAPSGPMGVIYHPTSAKRVQYQNNRLEDYTSAKKD
ncbi:MAG: right-handed parallel beta-helix repeat-containing protein, partial [Candidatus Methylacidiphilales bacterium]